MRWKSHIVAYRRLTMSMLMFVLMAMMVGGQTTTTPSSSESNQQPPKIVVYLDEVMLEENRHIPDIFDKINTLSGHAVTGVHFDTVIVTNESTALHQACSKLQDGMVAMIDMTSRRVAPLLRSKAGSAGIAYISMVDNSYYRNTWGDEELNWRVEPTSVQLLHVIADIVRHEKLNNVALVYDDTFDIQNTPRRILTNVPAQHLYVRISESEEETQRQVLMLKDISIKSIFIIASDENAKKFLGMINNQTVDTPFPNLFVLTKEAKLNCERCHNKMRVVVMTGKTSHDARMVFMQFMKDSGVALHFDSDEIKVDEALVYDVARLIRSAMPSSLTSIAYSDCFNVTTARQTDRQQSKMLVNALKNQSVDGVFGAFETRQDLAGYKFTIMLSEMIFEEGNMTQQVQIDEWSESSGLNGTTSLTEASKKRHYRVVTVPGILPFVYKESNGTGGPTYYGYCIELLDALADLMDFEYVIYDSPDGLFGAMADDGSWSGVINELIEKRADIAVGPISVMAERENVVDFTVPYYDLVGLTILMRKPEFDYSLGKFLSVLDEGVWGCILAAFVVFSVLICIFDRLSPFSYQNNRKDWKGEGQEPRVFTFKEGIWFCMMSLTPQGGGETPRALSGRLVAATWWLFGFIIIATYTANLAAFLTVSRLETKIESLDDLSKQFKVKYAPMNGSNAQMYFQRMADIEKKFYQIWKDMSLSNTMEAVERAKLAVWDYPVSDKYTKLWNTMQDTGFPPNKKAALELVFTGDFAFISDATTNKYATYTNCDLWEVGDEFSRKPYALAVQEGSPLRSELSNVILQLINQRKLEEMKTKWWDRDKKDCPDSEDESDGISIQNIGGVFLVIVIGSALALIMLAFECYWYKYKPKQKKKLYNVTSRTNLTKAPGMSTASLASAAPDSNGVKPADTNNHVNNTVYSNGREETGFTNDGFVEMTERL
ncbi:ionotropic receptor 25a-like [Littorina saxatilis]|uniref:Uncharacterized protein n=1 Tax=Littorina saxatilis TaxID=31220 RepID=A0AAN9BQN0_9CAEN